MKLRTKEKVERIKEALHAGASRQEIISNLGAEFGLSAGTIGNLITVAYNEIDDEAWEREEIVSEVRKKEIREVAREEIVNELEIATYLTKIIRRETTEDKIVYTPSGMIDIAKLSPRLSDVMKAIRLFRETLPSHSRPLGETKSADNQ